MNGLATALGLFAAAAAMGSAYYWRLASKVDMRPFWQLVGDPEPVDENILQRGFLRCSVLAWNRRG